MDVAQVIAIVLITSAVNLLVIALIVRHDFKDVLTKEDL